MAEEKDAGEGIELSEKERNQIMPMERIKMIMTRGKDDPGDMYDLLGTKENRKELDGQFKNDESNFKIFNVIDVWFSGFDVSFLNSIYNDKSIKQHNLIQTFSRLNRRFTGNNKGLVVDYIGIKK